MRIAVCEQADSMTITEVEFRELALNDPKGFWELHCGQLRYKPQMSLGHNQTLYVLLRSLIAQLDPSRFAIGPGFGHVRRSPDHYYIPDLYVVPMEILRPMLDHPRELEVYETPLPLVVEVWSPSTGDYDVESKLPEYQRRGDLEIWYIHPFDRSLRAWRRQPDGSYSETEYTGGTIQPVALPGVTIDINALFNW
jgi:Uma2 family endonuclease